MFINVDYYNISSNRLIPFIQFKPFWIKTESDREITVEHVVLCEINISCVFKKHFVFKYGFILCCQS